MLLFGLMLGSKPPSEKLYSSQSFISSVCLVKHRVFFSNRNFKIKVLIQAFNTIPGIEKYLKHSNRYCFFVKNLFISYYILSCRKQVKLWGLALMIFFSRITCRLYLFFSCKLIVLSNNKTLCIVLRKSYLQLPTYPLFSLQKLQYTSCNTHVVNSR